MNYQSGFLIWKALPTSEVLEDETIASSLITIKLWKTFPIDEIIKEKPEQSVSNLQKLQCETSVWKSFPTCEVPKERTLDKVASFISKSIWKSFPTNKVPLE